MNVNDLDFLFFVISILGALLAPVILVVVGILLFRSFSKPRKQRIEDLQRFSAETGLAYIGEGSVYNIPGYAYYRLFNLVGDLGRKIENLFQGTIRGFQVSVFNYRRFGSAAERNVIWQTVVMIRSPRINLPWFSLSPQGKSLMSRINDALTPDINFSSNPAFSASYRLLGSDEAGIRQVFDSRVLAYFEAGGGSDKFVVEGGGNAILLYRHGSLAAPAEMRPMLEEALRIAGLFAR
jgi:hypothetical protein